MIRAEDGQKGTVKGQEAEMSSWKIAQWTDLSPYPDNCTDTK